MSSLEPMTPHPAGTVIGGRYEVESLIGKGGMGSVWRAQHVTLHTPIALKFIDPKLLDEDGVQARFMIEARSAATLRSSHIVQVFDFGVDAGVPYIAMEMLSGENLAVRIEKGPISPADTAVILTEIGRAMNYAHEQEVIHRDLKPENIFLCNEGENQVTKVLDFGVAKVAGPTKPLTLGGATRTGSLLGTPYYISPEQARGNRVVDYRTDLWAIGVIVFECLTGKKPFESDGLGDLLMMICNDPHRSVGELSLGNVVTGDDIDPDKLKAWFAQALAKDPDDRFQSARQMADSFHQLVFGEKRPSFVDTLSLGRDSLVSISEEGPEGRTTDGLAQSILMPTPKPRGLTLGKALGAAGVLLMAVVIFASSGAEKPSSAKKEHANTFLGTPLLAAPPHAGESRALDLVELTEEPSKAGAKKKGLAKGDTSSSAPSSKKSGPTPEEVRAWRARQELAKEPIPSAEDAFGDRK